ncbi:MAG: ATP-binding protein [Leptospirales bacterium]
MIDNSDKWRQNQEKKLLGIFQKRVGTTSAQEIAGDKTGEKAALMEEAFSMQRKLLREEYLPFWNTATNQLKYLVDATSTEFALGAMNREMEKLREKDTTLSELAQLGLVVETVSHEYHSMFNNAAKIFQKIHKSAEHLPEQFNTELYHLEKIFHSIDERLRFLEPLYRRKRGGIGNINGMEIRNFIENSFDEEFRGNITISYTKKFLNTVLPKVKIPVVYAAIFNIVNNALYWIQKTSEKPEIRLSYYPHGFVISDTGSGVSERDRTNIFEPFFSRKEQGRGLGLYIVKTTLESADMNIFLAEEPETGALPGANFIVKKPDLPEEDNGNDV